MEGNTPAKVYFGVWHKMSEDWQTIQSQRMDEGRKRRKQKEPPPNGNKQTNKQTNKQANKQKFTTQIYNKAKRLTNITV